jgi:zinc D-Ala-D-Ala carboxypeptidase
MRNRRVHLLVIIVALACVASVIAFAPRGSRGQSRTTTRTTRSTAPTKSTGLTTSGGKPTQPAVSSAAASQNQVLRNELSWTFGGKQQRGWYLYDQLLSTTLDTNDSPVTADFANAVAKWQKRRGLSANGVLDQNSWMAMVSHWQSNRLKNRAAATPDQLVTGSPSDFYDPSRAAELRQVERETYAAYRKMLAAAIQDLKLAHTSSGELAPGEKYLKIVSSFRSREYQDALRRKSPNAGSAGLAVNSPHFTGRALDLYVGGDPVDTKDANRAIQVNTPAYKWLVRNAERFGFRPYFYEPWHWEYVR